MTYRQWDVESSQYLKGDSRVKESSGMPLLSIKATSYQEISISFSHQINPRQDI
jgi:hypothetical protein